MSSRESQLLFNSPKILTPVYPHHRSWKLLSEEDKGKIRDYLVTYSINRFNAVEVFVLNQILQTVEEGNWGGFKLAPRDQ